jgi:RNA polymerase sigma-70 factor, ECF subfamily
VRLIPKDRRLHPLIAESSLVIDWDHIVADHGPMILRLACRILGHGPDAEDAVQEAFLQVYRIGQEQEVESWGGLLHRAVVHRSLDRLRRRRKRAAEPLDDQPVGREDDPQETAAARELSDRLRHAISRLPEQQAAVFCLRYFDDLPYGRIAENLGIEVGAVASALHKARGKLKSLLTVSVQED